MDFRSMLVELDHAAAFPRAPPAVNAQFLHLAILEVSGVVYLVLLH